MPGQDSPLEDLLRFAERALGALMESRDAFGMKAKGETIARKLGLVGRDEFDAAFAMLAKARMIQEDLSERLDAIEAKLNLSSPQRKKQKTKKSLRTVKHKAPHKRRV